MSKLNNYLSKVAERCKKAKTGRTLDPLKYLSLVAPLRPDTEALREMVKLLRRHVSVFEHDQLNINCLDAELEALVPAEE